MFVASSSVVLKMEMALFVLGWAKHRRLIFEAELIPARKLLVRGSATQRAP